MVSGLFFGGGRWLWAVAANLWVWVVEDFVCVCVYIFVKVFLDYFNVLNILF